MFASVLCRPVALRPTCLALFFSFVLLVPGAVHQARAGQPAEDQPPSGSGDAAEAASAAARPIAVPSKLQPLSSNDGER